MKRVILLVLILLAAASINSKAADSSNVTEIKLSKNLKSSVTVKYDASGIPSIYADSLYDLTFAEGYIHATHRFFQMDINRRRTTGRLAEIYGKGSVGEDLSIHLPRLPEVSQEIWDECVPIECELFQAYSDGVNAYLESLTEPPAEYKQMGITPEPWSPVDSIAIGRGMSWGMSSDIGLEIALGVISKLLGSKTIMKILPIEGVDPITIFQDDDFSSFPADILDVEIANHLDRPIFDKGHDVFDTAYGSNNWVVSGSRTDSGKAMLSNDTHMGFGLPCDWYEVQLKSPELHVSGLSVPGTPGIITGHNEYVAWGVTQARYDVSDAYIERLDPARPDTHYMHKGESLPFEIQTVKIKYKTDDGFDFEERTVLHTIHGPVVYEDGRPMSVISMRWTGHVPTHESLAFWGYMTAKNLDDFKAAQEHFEVGALNFVYADVDGNIYYRAPGKVPLRKGKPFLPLDGSSGDYEWQGYIPYDELPSVENPERGYIVTANNRIAPMNFKYYLGAIFDKGYRARRISDMIMAAEPMTFETMQKIQYDVYSLPAEHLLPLLYTAAEEQKAMLSPSSVKALDILRKWDRFDTVDSFESSIFYTWLKHVTINIFKDNLPGEIFNKVDRSEVVYPFILVDKKLSVDFYDDLTTSDIRETKNIILTKSINDAMAELEINLGADMAEWQWGKIHKVSMGHRLGGDWNIEQTPGPGGTDSINVATFGLSGNFNYGGGPNMRMTTEMNAGKIRGVNIIAGGQSGDKDSPNYRDQFPLWLNGKYHSMHFDDGEVDGSTVNTTILKP